MDDMNSEEIEKCMQLLKEVPNIASGLSDVLQSISRKIERGESQMNKGLSFLNLKNLNMLDYEINLCYLILRKLHGKKIENDPVIQRLVELRIVMEKMRPIDDKLKYHVNKLLANANCENVDTKDPLQFRANPESLEAEEEEDEQEVQKDSKVYVPPKIAASYYDEGNVMEQKKKKLEQAQKRALSSSMLYELRREYDTAPEEIKETLDPYKSKWSEEFRKRKIYEEENMLRLPMTKRERHEMRQLNNSNFNMKFEDISALEMGPDDIQLKKKSKGKKGKFYRSKGKKKGFKKKY